MAILPVGIGPQEGGYQIERSLRFNSADSADLNRTFSTPTDNNRCTISLWVKKTTNSAGPLDFGFLTTGVNISVVGISGTGAYGASLDNKIFIRNNDTNKDYWYPVLRDNSAWYHIVIAINTDESTQADRAKLWINGVSQASNKQASGFSLSEALTFNTASTVHRIGSIGTSYPTYYSNGYLSEYYFIDGQALDPTSFGEYNTDTGVWQPKAYTGSYGTNGFYLDFSDNSGTTSTTLGKDYSGNSNNWTPNNFSVTAGSGNDSLVDTPTPYGTDTGVGAEVRGNYATLNPLNKPSTSTITNGNLDVTHTSVGGEQPATFAISSGKWYWEATPNSGFAAYGIILTSAIPHNNSILNGYHYYGGNGQFYTGTSGVSYGATFTSGDVIGIALDLDTNQITFYKNGTSQGAKSISAGEYYPDFGAAGVNTTNCNFGQRPFAYAAPTGFKALCTTNLPDPAIADGSQYFDILLHTGNGSTQSVTGTQFQPDFAWIKTRSNAYPHALVDVVRGATNQLRSNGTDAEYTGGVSSFLSNGISLNNNYNENNSGMTYVDWLWKAGGTGVSNTAGSITSTVSANPTAGFSIVTYTGTGALATVGHGLGVAPKMILIKSRSQAANWTVYHSSVGNTGALFLNLTNATDTGSAYWNNTSPTSSVFTIYLGSASNTSGQTYVAYCFAPVAGYSAFGSFVGNGSSTDGPFIFTGFRPKFILAKKTSGTSNWSILDTARDGYNVADNPLLPNLSNAESTSTSTSGAIADILSNGFKVRGNSGDINDSGATYVYAAFAESPFKYSLAR